MKILLTTQHRGVWFGEVDDDCDLTQRTLTNLRNARCAIRWATTGGVQELAERGPNAKSKIGSVADMLVVHDVTAVWRCTDKAIAAWEAAL